jgi:hypothetical protein
MKLLIIALSLLSIATLLVFCKHTKYTADTMPKAQIRFGRGGGFTGMEQKYTLLSNGQLFDGGKTELDSAKKRVAKACFKTAEKLGLEKLAYTNPGNTYSFIEVPSGEGFNRISWGGQGAAVDAAIVQLHEQLMGLLPQKSFKPEDANR